MKVRLRAHGFHRNLAAIWLVCWLGGLSACAAPAPAPQVSTPSLAAAAAFTPSPVPDLPTPAPSPTPSPPARCAETTGRDLPLAAVTSASGHLQARVHLPPCYDASGKTRYPVLYLLHGQGFTADQWERLGFLKAADARAASGANPFLIVLPAEDNTTLNPYDSPFGPALVSALVPQVDKEFNTCAQRTCRAIGGLSRGASWAIYLGLKHWGQFSIIGAHSFPPFFGLDRDLPSLLSSIAPGQAPRIYMDTGYSDPYRAPAAQIEEMLNRAAIPHEWYINAGGHDEAYWSAHVPAYLAWYAAQFDLVLPK